MFICGKNINENSYYTTLHTALNVIGTLISPGGRIFASDGSVGWKSDRYINLILLQSNLWLNIVAFDTTGLTPFEMFTSFISNKKSVRQNPLEKVQFNLFNLYIL